MQCPYWVKTAIPVEEVLPDCWLTDAFSHVELRYKEGGTEKNLSLRREISTPVDFS